MFHQNFKETYSRKTVPNFIGTNSTPERNLQRLHMIMKIRDMRRTQKIKETPETKVIFLVRTIPRRCLWTGRLYPQVWSIADVVVPSSTWIFNRPIFAAHPSDANICQVAPVDWCISPGGTSPGHFLKLQWIAVLLLDVNLSVSILEKPFHLQMCDMHMEMQYTNHINVERFKFCS